MIQRRKNTMTKVVSLRQFFGLAVFCIGTAVVFDLPGTALHAGENDKTKPAPAASEDSRPGSVLSDEEVLRLQSEKQDSIDRLEKTASEIARLWKEKQARNAAERTKPDPKTPDPKTPKTGNTNSQTNSQLPVDATSDVHSTTSDSASDTTAKRSEEMNPDANPSSVIDNSLTKPARENGASEISAATLNQTDPVVPQDGDANSAEPQSGDKSLAATPVSNVVDGPIDRLALATSLFATKELRECLKILEAVELRPLSVEDQQWHDYLAASCYRDLGKRSEAESLYRSVLQRSSSTWISSAARWWLDHIGERDALQQKLEDVETTIKNWRKEIDVLKSAN